MDLLEQGADQGGIALFGGGQLRGKDLTAFGIDRVAEFHLAVNHAPAPCRARPPRPLPPSATVISG